MKFGWEKHPKIDQESLLVSEHKAHNLLTAQNTAGTLLSPVMSVKDEYIKQSTTYLSPVMSVNDEDTQYWLRPLL